ncbi:MAG: ABC transporter permease [Planctomycetaceae bacterium]|nr:ABC transporter permease [Planctomycetaceae bacterium]
MNSEQTNSNPTGIVPGDQPAASVGKPRMTVIEPQTGWVSLNLPEVWHYRDLLQLLVWRDVSARYRQSFLGISWAIFRPLLTALIYTLVFSVFVKVQTDVPYPLFAFAALIPWMYFSAALSSVTTSVAAAGGLLTKVYFPRLVLPIAAAGPGLIEVGIQLIIVAGLMAVYRYPPTSAVVFLPIFVGLTVLTAFAFGVWLTALNVKYRDVGMAVPFFLQIWMYLCPIVYPLSLVPERFRQVYSLNPMVGVIEGFRWSLIGSASPEWTSVGLSAGVLFILLISGLYFFRRTESAFADVI